jgi:hypothetical protein
MLTRVSGAETTFPNRDLTTQPCTVEAPAIDDPLPS